MSKQNLQSALRLLAIAGGAGLIAYLILRAGPRNLWQEVMKLGWGLALVIVLAGVAHLVKTWAWQMTLGKDRHKVSFPRLLDGIVRPEIRIFPPASGEKNNYLIIPGE
jgi:hypothetical protein